MIQLKRKHIDPAIKTLTRAFYNEPLHITYFPETSIREKNLKYLLKFNILSCLKLGIGFSTSYNFEGVALWRLIDPQEKAKF